MTVPIAVASFLTFRSTTLPLIFCGDTDWAIVVSIHAWYSLRELHSASTGVTSISGAPTWRE
ncbi:hypothetical protein Q671_04950 [Halomonas sp. PBN3]|nr:hypothetical protein Q671_04950 [Halomonas sp. PBN3]